jgi:hypothetical protein
MTRTGRIAVTIAVASVATLGVSLVGAQAKESCVRAGGQATMMTEDMAKFMAQAALKNSISGMGAKPVGKVALNCSTNMGMANCTAKQKACK